MKSAVRGRVEWVSRFIQNYFHGRDENHGSGRVTRRTASVKITIVKNFLCQPQPDNFSIEICFRGICSCPWFWYEDVHSRSLSIELLLLHRNQNLYYSIREWMQLSEVMKYFSVFFVGKGTDVDNNSKNLFDRLLFDIRFDEHIAIYLFFVLSRWIHSTFHIKIFNFNESWF